MVWPVALAVGGTLLSARDANNASQAASQASQMQTQYGMDGLEEQRRQFNLSNQLLSPIYNTGAAQLPYLQQNAQSRDLMQFQGIPAFDNLLSENLQNTRNQVYGAGQSRSGWGQRQIGSSLADTLASLENTTTNRMQSLAGQAQTAGNSLGALGQSNVNQMTGLLQGIGDAQYKGALAQQSADAQFGNNLVTLGAGLANYYRK